MNQKINNYVNNIFEPYEEVKSIKELKSDLLSDLNERFEELMNHGEREDEAITKTINSIGDIQEILGEMENLTHTLEHRVTMNFSAQELSGSDFSGVTLHGGKFEASAMKSADFSGADLTGSSFKSSDLREANFHGANLTDCNFSTLDLRDVNFKESVLVRTNFDKAGMDGAKFTGVKLKDVNFSMVDMRKVTFEDCMIDGGEFTYTDMTGQQLDGMTIRNAQLGKGCLEGVSFKDATLNNVSFTPPFALTNKYYKIIKTIEFEGASMDKLTYNALKGLGAKLSGVTVL